MIIISQRQHVMTLSSAILLLLPLIFIGLASGLQQNPTFTCLASRRLISSYPHQQSTSYRSFSASAVAGDDVIGDASDALSEDQSQSIIAYDWDEQFEELQTFLSEYGHCNVPQNTQNKKYPMLKKFCHDQRVEYQRLRNLKSHGSKKKSLAVFDLDVRCRRLEELGFEFNSQSAQWYDHYHELIQYSKEHGHLRVTERDNATLANWVKKQRARRNVNKGFTKLTESQIKLLDDIGFEWKSELNDEKWNSSYTELVAFRNKHGHFLMYHADPLYFWMNMQRQRRAAKKGNAALTAEQIRLLDEIEFPWEPERLDSRWQAQYEKLQRFQRNHGHCRPKQRTTHDGLYKWCFEQRRQYDNGGLSKERIKLLDQIGFNWDRSRAMWGYRYNELCEFCNEHGHLGVSQDDHPDLYEWMDTQRQQYHEMVKPALTDERIEKLEDMHFCWSLDFRERTWHEKYTDVVEFFKEHGHVVVAKKENPSLHNWIQMQEKRYKEAKGQKPLSEEELELLEQLDFPFLDGQPRMAWNTMYAKLARYREDNDGRFPTRNKDDRDLNRWMRQQRHRLRCAFGYVPLSDEQKSLLENIDIPMYPKGKQWRSWYEKYDMLVEFRKEHGHFVVDRSDNYSLNRWIELQRARFKGTRSPQLSRLQIYLLKRIGFPWASDRIEIEWQEMYEELVEFGKEHGHLRASRFENPKLFHWIGNQRARYKDRNGSELPKYQIQLLERIGFKWSC